MHSPAAEIQVGDARAKLLTIFVDCKKSFWEKGKNYVCLQHNKT